AACDPDEEQRCCCGGGNESTKHVHLSEKPILARAGRTEPRYPIALRARRSPKGGVAEQDGLLGPGAALASELLGLARLLAQHLIALAALADRLGGPRVRVALITHVGQPAGEILIREL